MSTSVSTSSTYVPFKYMPAEAGDPSSFAKASEDMGADAPKTKNFVAFPDVLVLAF